MGVHWGYQWNYVFTTTSKPFPASNQTVYELPYQIVNQIRSKPSRVWDVFLEGCPGNPDPYSGDETYNNSSSVQAARRACVADIAQSRPGSYWLIWNEPDDNSQDNLSPMVGAQYFKEISDTILIADPSARLIVGNVGSRYFGLNPPPPYDNIAVCNAYCGVDWLSAFVTAFMTLTNGATPYSAISGYGFHSYGHNVAPGDCPGDVSISTTLTEQCLITRWTSIAMTGVNWVQAQDPDANYKEIWLSEINWAWIELGQSWDVQIARMSSICAVLPTLSVNRYGWFIGIAESGRIKSSLFAWPFTGALNPGGQNFTTACAP